MSLNAVLQRIELIIKLYQDICFTDTEIFYSLKVRILSIRSLVTFPSVFFFFFKCFFSFIFLSESCLTLLKNASS